MSISKMAGFTLTELLIVIIEIALMVVILLPMHPRMNRDSRRTTCGQNMGQIHKAVTMYETDYGGCYPTRAAKEKDQYTDGDAQEALNLLYRQYTDDVRIFSCPSKPLSQAFMNKIAPTTATGWPTKNGSSFQEWSAATPSYSTSYGYSVGHNSSQNSRVIILADRHGSGANGNSDNHGLDAGQNTLSAGGAVEFRGGRNGKINQLGMDDASVPVVDPDIFSLNPLPISSIQNGIVFAGD